MNPQLFLLFCCWLDDLLISPLPYIFVHTTVFFYSLDWSYNECIKEGRSVDRFEEFRDGKRRMLAQLKIPAVEARHDLLIANWDVPVNTMLQASLTTKIERDKRMKTALKFQRRQMRKIELLNMLLMIVCTPFNFLCGKKKRKCEPEQCQQLWYKL